MSKSIGSIDDLVYSTASHEIFVTSEVAILLLLDLLALTVKFFLKILCIPFGSLVQRYSIALVLD